MAQVLRQVSQLLVMSIWRRKSMMLAAILCTTVVIVCLQYSSVGGNDLDSPSNPTSVQNRRRGPPSPLGMDPPDSKSHKAMVPRRNLSALSNQGGAALDSNSIDRKDGRGYAEIRHQRADESGLRLKPEDQANGQSDRADRQVDWTNNRVIQNGWIQDNRQQQAFHGVGVQQSQQSGSTFIPQLRLVHLDLKGAPPKVSYLKQLFPLMKAAGANGILLEYEDMFPYWGMLAPTAAGNAYSKDDISTILMEARANGFEVIPLIQTFGHLEYALKLEPYRKLREVDDFPQAICPSRNESFNLVKTIIDQMVALHPKLKWLHVGCDEVYHLGYCNKCIQQDRENLFLGHVQRVAQYVREKHNIIPIIWDDMLRQIPTDKLKQYKLGSLVEPMIWTYVKDIYRFIPYNVWLTYGEIFPFIWGASAFKGAFGETLTVPNVRMHLENHEAWLEVLNEQQKRFQAIRGLALTGWQRYDHFGTLCELLPSGIPSLFIDLLTVSNGHYNTQVLSKFQQILQCNTRTRSPVDFETDPYLWSKASGCFFPGSSVFRMTQHHADAVKRINDYLYDVTIHKAWLTEYNIRHNITSVMRVDEGLTEYSSNYYPLTSLMRTARDSLREVYDEFTVAEWIEQNVYPYIYKMEKLWKDGTDLKKAKTWPRRPLKPLEDLKRFQIGDSNSVGDQQNPQRV